MDKTENNKMAHQCSICFKIFKCASKLQRHHLIHTGERPFICSVCGKAFRQAIHLKKHLETHTGNPFTLNPVTSSGGPFDSVSRDETVPSTYSVVQEESGCDYTPDVLLNFSEVDELKQTRQPEGYAVDVKPVDQLEFKLKCPDGALNTDWEGVSGKDPTKQILQEHQLNSYDINNDDPHTENVLECAICLKVFSSPYQLQRHLLVHTQLKPFECSVCKQTFRSMAQLNLHSQTHTESDLSQNIKVHLNSATEQASQGGSSKRRIKVNHQCPECPKSFGSPYKLRRHCLIHTGQRPFHCIECGKTFRQLAHLKTHQDTHRTLLSIQTPLYERSIAYPQRSKFEDGNSDIHQPSEAKLPSFISPASVRLQGHTSLNSHQPFNIDLSSNMTFSQKSLQMEKKHEVSVLAPQHINEWSHEDGQIIAKKAFNESSTNLYQCNICSKSFNFAIKLRQHYLTHKKMRPFQCLVCGQTFCLAAHLQNHLSKHTNQDEFSNQGEDLVSALSPSGQPHHQMAEHNDCDHKMTPKADEVNALDLNIIVKQEHWLSSSNEEQASTPDVIATTTEYQPQPALDDINSKNQLLMSKTHQCSICLKCFPTPSKLQRHLAVHAGQRPFGCHLCGKKFRQLAHLMLHARTHFRLEHVKLKKNEMDSDSSPLQFKHDGVSSGSSLKSDAPMNENIPETLESEEPFLMSTGLNAPSRRLRDMDLDVRDKSLNHQGNANHIKHQCLICFKCFSCPSKLQRHHLIHTGQKPFRCFLCGKTFRQAVHLKVHQQTHNKWRPFRRAVQQKEVVNADISSTSREKHLGSESGYQDQWISASESPGYLPISDCTNQLTKEEHISDHNSITAGAGRNDRTMHFEINTIIKAEDCHSNSNSDLQSVPEGMMSLKQCHPQLTSDDCVNKFEKAKKTYQCVTCLKCFSTPYKLQRHILTHTGQRPFTCYICGKKFRQVAHLNLHIRTHNQTRITKLEKALEDSTGKTLSSDLLLHKTTAEKELDKSLDNEGDIFSLQQVECNRKDSTTATEADLTQQKSLQNIEPEKSLQVNPDQSALREKGLIRWNALASEGNKSHGNHQCLLCSKFFSCPSKLRRHHLIHTGQKPFQCFQCEKTFRQAIHLKVHQQTHNKLRHFRRASRQNELISAEDSSSSEQHFREPAYQGNCTVSSIPQSHLITSDGSHPERKEDNDSDFDHEMSTLECTSVNSPPVNSDPETVRESRDWCQSSDDLQSAPGEERKIIKQCEQKLAFQNDVHKYEAPNGKTYQCVTCLKCFSTSFRLQRHILTHTGQKPFSCYICGKRFHHLAHMKLHVHNHNWPRITQQKKNVGGIQLSLQKESDRVSSITTSEPVLPQENALQNIGLEKRVEINIVTSERELDRNNYLSSESNRRHGKHQCLLCLKWFSCPSKLQRHHLVHTGQKPFRCILCGKTFRQAVHLKVHQQTHNKWRPFRRAIRQDVLVNTEISSSSRKHFRRTSSYQQQCILPTTPLNDLTTHDCLRKMDKEKDFSQKRNTPDPVCVDAIIVPEDLCPSNENTQSTSHEATVLNKQSKLELASKENVNTFQKLKRNSYQCATCLKFFSTPSKLQRHILTHTGQRPFSCYVCGKKFRQLAHMKFHIRTHNRPRITLQKKAHEVSPVTAVSLDLLLHENTPEKGSDESFEISFKPTASLEGGLNRDTAFDDERNHGKIKNQCLFCFKCFPCPSKLQRHTLIHTGQKPFQCILCGKMFRQSIHLKVHQQTHNECRASRRASHREELDNTGRPREQLTDCTTISTPPTNGPLQPGLMESPLTGKEGTDDGFTRKVMLEENENHLDMDSNIAFFKESQCFTALSQQKSNLTQLLQRPFKCNICHKTFTQLAHLKTHYNSHIDTYSVNSSSPIKTAMDQNQNCSPLPVEGAMHYGLEEAQDVDFSVDKTVDFSSTYPQYPSLGTDSVSEEMQEKRNSQDQTSEEASDSEGRNKPKHVHQCCPSNQCFDSNSDHKSYKFSHTGHKLGFHDHGSTVRDPMHLESGKAVVNSAKPGGSCDACQNTASPDIDRNVQGGSNWSILRNNSSFPNIGHLPSTPGIPTTQEREQNWDGFAPFDQEEPDCIIIESSSTARVESLVSHWQATESSEISHNTSKYAHQYTDEDGRDSGHCNQNNIRLSEEHDEQELPVSDYGASVTTTEPVPDSWHPVASGYSSDNNNSFTKDIFNSISLMCMSKLKHTKKSYLCKVCSKTFDTPSKLSRHFLIHTGMKPFKCYVCSKSFRQLCHLQSHQQTHREKTVRDEQQMDCGQKRDDSEDCPPQIPVSEGHFSAAVPQEEELKGALYVPDYNTCSLQSSTSLDSTINSSLDHPTSASVGIQHIIPDVELKIKIKRSKREHKCSVCQKSFSSPSKLERHYLIHAGKRPFNCCICGKAFRQAAHLKVHQRIHSKTSEIHCSFSSEVLDTGNKGHDSCHSHQMEDISETHAITGTNEDLGEGQETQVAGVEVAIEPEQCDEYWCEPLDELFNCEVCNKSFVSERRLKFHRCSKRNAWYNQPSFYQCAICFKKFKSPSKLKRHYVIHTGQRPFKCSVCKKTFTQSGHLKTHQLSHK